MTEANTKADSLRAAQEQGAETMDEFISRINRVCKCEHTSVHHAGATPRACLKIGCDCESFVELAAHSKQSEPESPMPEVSIRSTGTGLAVILGDFQLREFAYLHRTMAEQYKAKVESALAASPSPALAVPPQFKNKLSDLCLNCGGCKDPSHQNDPIPCSPCMCNYPPAAAQPESQGVAKRLTQYANALITGYTGESDGDQMARVIGEEILKEIALAAHNGDAK